MNNELVRLLKRQTSVFQSDSILVIIKASSTVSNEIVTNYASAHPAVKIAYEIDHGKCNILKTDPWHKVPNHICNICPTAVICAQNMQEVREASY